MRTKIRKIIVNEKECFWSVKDVSYYGNGKGVLTIFLTKNDPIIFKLDKGVVVTPKMVEEIILNYINNNKWKTTKKNY